MNIPDLFNHLVIGVMHAVVILACLAYLLGRRK